MLIGECKILQIHKLKEIADLLLMNHDEGTHKHCKNVGDLMKKFAGSLHIPKKIITQAYYVGYFHDIGKVWIPSELLRKKSSLNHFEYKIMQQHSYLGYLFLARYLSGSDIAFYVLFHHEHYDGTGYPSRIEDNQIPLISRMLSICDTFDAMTTDRPYHTKCLPEKALAELQKNAGSQFDPKLVENFCSLF